MNNIDTTMDNMGNTKFFSIFGNMIRQQMITYGLSYNEVIGLLMVYYKFVLANGPRARQMTKKQLHILFLVVFRIYDISIIEHIMLTMTTDVKFVSPESWIKLVDVFVTKNLKQRMEFAFNVYTNSGALVLSRERVALAVDKFFVGDDDDEVLELRADMCEYLFNKFDTDKDGIIQYEEYASIILHQPLLMEFLGQVFPDIKDVILIAHCTNMLSILEKEQ